MPGRAGGAPRRVPTLEADTESPQKLKCLPQARKALSCTVLVNAAVIGWLLGLRWLVRLSGGCWAQAAHRR